MISLSHIADAVEEYEIEHDDDKGSSIRQTSSTESSARRFAKAMCYRYIQYLKESDPGRIRKMLRDVVSARIRRTVHSGSRDAFDLRWSDKSVMKALSRWRAVFVQGERERERERECVCESDDDEDGR